MHRVVRTKRWGVVTRRAGERTALNWQVLSSVTGLWSEENKNLVVDFTTVRIVV